MCLPYLKSSWWRGNTALHRKLSSHPFHTWKSAIPPPTSYPQFKCLDFPLASQKACKFMQRGWALKWAFLWRQILLSNWAVATRAEALAHPSPLNAAGKELGTCDKITQVRHCTTSLDLSHRVRQPSHFIFPPLWSFLCANLLTSDAENPWKQIFILPLTHLLTQLPTPAR